MTGPEHYKKAEQLLESADEWLDADQGWKQYLSTEERLSRRASDLAAAQVHASLAQVAAYVGGPLGKWRDVIEGPKPEKPAKL